MSALEYSIQVVIFVLPRCNLTLISPFSASGGISRARGDDRISLRSDTLFSSRARI
nr:MAG TPA: hypothetical protein [Caudoviricetes sp.]